MFMEGPPALTPLCLQPSHSCRGAAPPWLRRSQRQRRPRASTQEGDPPAGWDWGSISRCLCGASPQGRRRSSAGGSRQAGKQSATLFLNEALCWEPQHDRVPTAGAAFPTVLPSALIGGPANRPPPPRRVHPVVLPSQHCSPRVAERSPATWLLPAGDGCWRRPPGFPQPSLQRAAAPGEKWHSHHMPQRRARKSVACAAARAEAAPGAAPSPPPV